MESPPSSDVRKVNISKRQYENVKSTLGELPPSVLSKDGTELYTTYGYRHSDTVAITEDGTDQLTYFPRDLEPNVVR